jgi:hypothetical protein
MNDFPLLQIVVVFHGAQVCRASWVSLGLGGLVLGALIFWIGLGWANGLSSRWKK